MHRVCPRPVHDASLGLDLEPVPRSCLSVVPRGEAEDVRSALFCFQAGFFLGVLPGEGTIVLFIVLNPPILYRLNNRASLLQTFWAGGQGNAGKY